ncbi:hypothetical protein F66182_6693 [Fusarium sp. NRRL 66182]|nr:hypothetical protein F66182_6693 [Fusarium sp. NRRL 66182]
MAWNELLFSSVGQSNALPTTIQQPSQAAYPPLAGTRQPIVYAAQGHLENSIGADNYAAGSRSVWAAAPGPGYSMASPYMSDMPAVGQANPPALMGSAPVFRPAVPCSGLQDIPPPAMVPPQGLSGYGQQVAPVSCAGAQVNCRRSFSRSPPARPIPSRAEVQRAKFRAQFVTGARQDEGVWLCETCARRFGTTGMKLDKPELMLRVADFRAKHSLPLDPEEHEQAEPGVARCKFCKRRKQSRFYTCTPVT